MALVDFVQLVTDKLRETASVVDTAQKERAIAEAVKDYSRKVRPRYRVQTVTGDGSAHTFALATDYEEGFSTLGKVENPVDKQEPEYLDADDVELYRDVTTGVLKLRFVSKVLANGEKAYVNYTARHSVTDGNPATDTVPVADRDGICCKATAILFRQLAAHYAQLAAPTLGADVVDRSAQSARYIELARMFDEQYATSLGIPDELAAASAVADLDVSPQYGGDRFWHSRLHR